MFASQLNKYICNNPIFVKDRILVQTLIQITNDIISSIDEDLLTILAEISYSKT